MIEDLSDQEIGQFRAKHGLRPDHKGKVARRPQREVVEMRRIQPLACGSAERPDS